VPDWVVIAWWEGGQCPPYNCCYLVHLPDFPEQTYRTHGDSYEEAARNGEEVLQLLLEEDGLALPKPRPSAAYSARRPGLDTCELLHSQRIGSFGLQSVLFYPSPAIVGNGGHCPP